MKSEDSRAVGIYESAKNNHVLAEISSRILNKVDENISQNGVNFKSVSESIALLGSLKKFSKEPELFFSKDTKYESEKSSQSPSIAKGLTDFMITYPSIFKASLHSRAIEYVADEFGTYFSGVEAAHSAQDKLSSLMAKPLLPHTQPLPKKEEKRSFVERFAKKTGEKSWRKLENSVSAHPRSMDRFISTNRGSFEENALARIKELQEKNDIER